MIYNFRQYDADPEMKRRCDSVRRWRLLLDGAEVRLVWYIDAEAGLVKTYDVWGDGKIYGIAQRMEDVPAGAVARGEVEKAGDLYSTTLRGTVTLIPPTLKLSCNGSNDTRRSTSRARRLD